MTFWGSGVAGSGHRRPFRPFESQSTVNARTTAVLFPGILLVNIQSWVMMQGCYCSLHFHVAINRRAIHPSRADYPKSQNSQSVSCSLPIHTELKTYIVKTGAWRFWVELVALNCQVLSMTHTRNLGTSTAKDENG
jgi:hypothetical protein